MTDLLQIPSFLLRKGDVKKQTTFVQRKKRKRKSQPKPPTHLGKAWEARLKRSDLVALHFTQEHPQISGRHLMWAFEGRRWVHVCSSRGTVRFKMKRADFHRIKVSTIKEAA
jgi:hypothetical protein